MDIFLKATAAILVTTILYLTVAKQSKEVAMLIVIAGSCMVVLAAISFLKPIIDFINKIKNITKLDNGILQVIIKAVGIGIITEITCLFCNDTGNASLGKSLNVLSTAIILWISLPIFEQLIELLDKVLGAI